MLKIYSYQKKKLYTVGKLVDKGIGYYSLKKRWPSELEAQKAVF